MTAICLKTIDGGYTFTVGGYTIGSVFDKMTVGGHTIGIGGYTFIVGGYTIGSVFDKTTDGGHTSTLGSFQNESIVRNYNPCFFISDKQNLSTI